MSDRRPGNASLVLLASLVATGGLGGPAAAAEPVAPVDLLRAADAARTPFAEGRIRLRVSLVAEERASAAGELDLYRGGDALALAVFRSGPQAGRRILMNEAGTWLLVPGARHAIAVSHQQRLAGAAAIADLVGPALVDRYEATLRPRPEDIRETPCWALDLRATTPGVAHPSGALWIGVDDGMPRRLLLRLPSGREARAIDFVAYRRQGAATVVARLEVRDLLRDRERLTIVEVLALEAFALDPGIFTLEGARALP